VIEFDLEPGAMEVLAIWYVAMPGSDWLACVLRKRDVPTWTLRYRFRYYAGSRDPFDESDKKSWYSAEGIDDSREELLAKVDATARVVALRSTTREVKRILVNGDGRKAWELLSAQPWAHVEIQPAQGRS
jgi:hypothetical protein